MTGHLKLPSRVEGRYLLELRRELRARLLTDPELLIDCHQVQHMSPAAQALLLRARRSAIHIGGHLHLDQPTPVMIAAVRATGLHHLLTQADPTPRAHVISA